VLATTVSSVYATEAGRGFSKALIHTYDEGLVVPCSHICEFISYIN